MIIIVRGGQARCWSSNWGLSILRERGKGDREGQRQREREIERREKRETERGTEKGKERERLGLV